MRRCVFFLVTVLACALSARAQQPLPERFGSWSASGAAAKTGPEAAERPSEAVPVFGEAGFVQGAARTYSSQSRNLAITLFRFRDPTGAYSAFTYLRPAGAVDSDLAQCAVVERDRAILLVGNLVADVRGLQGAAMSDVRDLVAALARSADRAPLPPLRSYLPSRAKNLGSERYVLGPAGFRAAIAALDLGNYSDLLEQIGFEQGAEAGFATYRTARGDAAMLLVEYPTPQAASLRQKPFETLAQRVNAGPRYFVRRKGSLLAFVFKPASTRSVSGQAAEALFGEVNYETQITWNEPGFKLTDPNWGVVIVGTILGIGALAVYAFLGGIGFGAIRIITKRFFPDKVFDRSAQFQILQLGINSKPIEWKDFY